MLRAPPITTICIAAALLAAGSAAFTAPVSAAGLVASRANATNLQNVKDFGSNPKILLFDSDVSVEVVSAGGISQPQAAWTEAAETGLLSAVERRLASSGFVLDRNSAVTEGQTLTDYREIVLAVLDAAVRHQLFSVDVIPAKRKNMDWTIGPGLANLSQKTGADFALVVKASAQFEARGRKTIRMLGLPGMGEEESQTAQHVGYAALFDLRSGNLVWINVDLDADGDLRSGVGQAEWTRDMFQSFPAKPK